MTPEKIATTLAYLQQQGKYEPESFSIDLCALPCAAEAESETIIVDKYGDTILILIVADANDKRVDCTYEFQVSSHVLRESSQYFSIMFKHDCLKAQPQTDGMDCLTAFDLDAKALHILLVALHDHV